VDNSSLKCVNQYAKLREIGRGACGKVFLAVDRQTHLYFAIKQISVKIVARSLSGLTQLTHEIELLRSLHHPNIVTLREVLHSESAGFIFVVTDFADCGSLDAVLAKAKLSAQAIQYIFKEIVAAISYLHSLRLVHQDIKPGNVLVSKNGKVMLTDFGMTHSFDVKPTGFGTPLYHAPEALDSESEDFGGREDVWSLGVTLYEMIFGEPPFPGKNVFEIIASVRNIELVPPFPVSDEIWDLLKGMMTVDPANRFDMGSVVNSPYVRNAPVKMEFADLVQIEIPEFDSNAPVIEQEAVLCGPDYKFEFRELRRPTDGQRVRCSSVPPRFKL
jgi:serine/threonine protein kinase